MCVSFHASAFSSTIVYGRATQYLGRWVHVLGYQNVAKNLAPGPNAMILPIPAAAPMGPDNAIDARAFETLLEVYRNALRSLVPAPRHAPRGRGGPVAHGGVQVFDSGSYTIVLAHDAETEVIAAALTVVPEAKRPPLNRRVLDAYRRWYHGWHIALCCFDTNVGKPEPMLWWYEPRDDKRVFLPGLDAHDGGVPEPGLPVAVDHTIALGIDDGDAARVLSATNVMPDGLPERLTGLFPHRVAGVADLKDELANGDWYLPADLGAFQHALRRRYPPPGF